MHWSILYDEESQVSFPGPHYHKVLVNVYLQFVLTFNLKVERFCVFKIFFEITCWHQVLHSFTWGQCVFSTKIFSSLTYFNWHVRNWNNAYYHACDTEVKFWTKMKMSFDTRFCFWKRHVILWIWSRTLNFVKHTHYLLGCAIISTFDALGIEISIWTRTWLQCKFTMLHTWNDIYYLFGFLRQKVNMLAPKHRRSLTTWQVLCQVKRRFHNQESNRQPLP